MKILIADDNANARQIIRRVLVSDLGADIREECSGLAALDALSEETFDLMILDIEMAPLGGIETLEAIRQTPEHRAMPVIIVSGVGTEDAVKHVKTLGVVGFVGKPLSLTVLRERLIPLIRKSVPDQPPATEVPIGRPVSLRSWSQVWLVGGDADTWGSAYSGLTSVCQVTHWPTAIKAAKQIGTTRPDAIFVSADLTALLPPVLFAKAIRNKSNTIPLFLCGRADQIVDDDRQWFDGTMTFEATPTIEDVLVTLRPSTTGASLALILLNTDSPVIAAIDDAFRNALDTTLESTTEVQRSQRTDVHDGISVEASTVLIVDDGAWKLKLIMPSTLLIGRAKEATGSDERVPHAAVLDCAKEVIALIGSSAADALSRYGIRARRGAVSSWVMPLREGAVSHQSSAASHWSATSNGRVIAVMSLEANAVTPRQSSAAAR